MSLLADPASLAALVLSLAIAGALIGFLARLFRIGGGAISVPVFYELFLLLGHAPQVAMPTAVGTSLAVIIPTSISSARGHSKRGTVDVELLRQRALPVILGVVIGAVVATFAEPAVFQLAFVVVASINAAGRRRLAAARQPACPACAEGLRRGRRARLDTDGHRRGAISTMFLTLHNVPIHRAVSTSAGVGVLIALPATLGYMAAGWGKPDLLPDAIGYVPLGTFLLTIPASLLTTRAGVTMAHALSRRRLETAFGLFLALVSLRFLFALGG